ncbi:MAG TPA: sulfate ABC transporter permease subunit CysT [Phycisphaerae bacterium]|nr:sulfate ABC transporter permease subunit CysT [Phycisphaerae bacterium]
MSEALLPIAEKSRRARRSILPGFGLTMGYTSLYVSLLVVIPLAGLFFKSATLPFSAIWAAATDAELAASLKITFGLSLVAGLINAVFGFIVAWTMVRYSFPGRKILDAVIDLPFALPTAVSGITLATLYSNQGVNRGWMGPPWAWVARHANSVLAAMHLPEFLPEQIAYTRLGMLIALVFIGLPFMVRTLEPALEDMDPEVEEAAASLGASRAQAFWRVVLPSLMPAVLTGFSLSFARAIGEYGSVIFISTNEPYVSEITAHLIMKKLENHQEANATVVGVVMLVISFALLLLINGLQWWAGRRSRQGVL